VNLHRVFAKSSTVVLALLILLLFWFSSRETFSLWPLSSGSFSAGQDNGVPDDDVDDKNALHQDNRETDFQEENLEKETLLTVVIDPGHGGFDPGAVVEEVKEKEINLEVAVYLKDYLEEAQLEVVMTRTGDYDLLPHNYSKDYPDMNRLQVDMKYRIKAINEAEADLVVSLHANTYFSPGCRGAQTFYHAGSKDSNKMAVYIQEQFKEYLESSRTASPHGFSLLENSLAPAVLVEVGFMTNPEERELLQKPSYQKELACTIYRGIYNYLVSQGQEIPLVDLTP